MPDKKPFVIKKYANRRLYDSHTSRHIVLRDLSRMVREGVDFQVLDGKTGADITHQILAQVVVEEAAHGVQLLPVPFLRQLIWMRGNALQEPFALFLEAAIENFRANHHEIQKCWNRNFGPGYPAPLAANLPRMCEAVGIAYFPKRDEARHQAVQLDVGSDAAMLRSQIAAMKIRIDSIECSSSKNSPVSEQSKTTS